MRLLKCPKCGEMFSDTYKTCPFCQEDEELHSGKHIKTGGRRVGGAKARPKVGGGVVVACLVLVLGLVACTIFGSQFTELFTGDKTDTPVRALTLSQRNADLTVGSAEQHREAHRLRRRKHRQLLQQQRGCGHRFRRRHREGRRRGQCRGHC